MKVTQSRFFGNRRNVIFAANSSVQKKLQILHCADRFNWPVLGEVPNGKVRISSVEMCAFDRDENSLPVHGSLGTNDHGALKGFCLVRGVRR